MTDSDSNSILKSRIDDIFAIVQQKNYAKFTSFLNENEVYFAKSFIEKSKYINYLFFGGCRNNKRKMLGVFPDFITPVADEFPIHALKIEFPSQYNLTHRDFLGSLMGLNITRDSIGDMIISKGSCIVFLRASVVPIVEEELKKVGSIGVSVVKTLMSDYTIQDKFKEITGTVSSFRLDSIIALICNISRDKSVSLIQNGMVSVNYTIIQTNHFSVCSDNILSIRGYGKYLITDKISKTKKGRYFLSILQFD